MSRPGSLRVRGCGESGALSGPRASSLASLWHCARGRAQSSAGSFHFPGTRKARTRDPGLAQMSMPRIASRPGMWRVTRFQDRERPRSQVWSHARGDARGPVLAPSTFPGRAKRGPGTQASHKCLGPGSLRVRGCGEGRARSSAGSFHFPGARKARTRDPGLAQMSRPRIASRPGMWREWCAFWTAGVLARKFGAMRAGPRIAFGVRGGGARSSAGSFHFPGTRKARTRDPGLAEMSRPDRFASGDVERVVRAFWTASVLARKFGAMRAGTRAVQCWLFPLSRGGQSPNPGSRPRAISGPRIAFGVRGCGGSGARDPVLALSTFPGRAKRGPGTQASHKRLGPGSLRVRGCGE
jgi:hypothetical protein